MASLGHPCKLKFQRVSRLAVVTAATSLTRGQPNFARCMTVSWPGRQYIHFRDILPPDGILPRAKFTFYPSTHHRTSFSGYIFNSQLRHLSTIGKKLTKQQYVLQMSNLSSRRLDVYHTYFHTWCGLSANLECRSAGGSLKMQDAKIAIWAPFHNFVRLYLRN